MDNKMPINAKTEEMAVTRIRPEVPFMARAPSLDEPRDPLAPFKAVAAVALASGPHRLACEPDLDAPRDPLAPFKTVLCCFPEFSQEAEEPEWTQEDEEEACRQTRLEERLEFLREEFRDN